jgi:zinc/manganese transport system substrate-binding protein
MLATGRAGMYWTVLVLVAAVAVLQPPLLARGGSGVRIVVTFQFMVGDIKNLLCPGDEVSSIVPQGVDPHEYQLTYSDLVKLAAADLIISTAHTPFEMRIREAVASGELRAELIEITKIPNMTFLSLPSTNAINYHGMLFHGGNYVAFINNVSNTLSRLRPECAAWYRDRAAVAEHAIRELEGGNRPLSGLKAVVDIPTLQYLATWLGAEVVHTLLVEHDVPPSPQDIGNAEELMKGFKGGVVAIFTEDSVARSLLEELASKYGARVLELPNPVTSTNSVLLYLQNATVRAQNLKPSASAGSSVEVATPHLAAAVAIVAVATALLALRRGVWR